MIKNFSGKIKYFNTKLSARHTINADNIEKLSKAHINNISKIYDKEIFDAYIRNVVAKWDKQNREYTKEYIKRFNNVIEKTEIKLDVFEKDYKNSLEPREFTSRRAMKTLEVPYEWKQNNLDQFALWQYKNIRLYIEKDSYLSKIYKSQMYISKNEIVFFDEKEQQILFTINKDDIKYIKKTRYSVLLRIKNKNYHIRYKDNEIIFISFDRNWPELTKENNIEESFSSQTTIEETIETILDIKN